MHIYFSNAVPAVLALTIIVLTCDHTPGSVDRPLPCQFRQQNFNEPSQINMVSIPLKRDRWANQTRSPQLVQQVIKVLPFPMNRLPNWLGGEATGSDHDHDCPEVRGFGCPNRHRNPLNFQSDAFKFHLFEFRGLGEVKPSRCYESW